MPLDFDVTTSFSSYIWSQFVDLAKQVDDLDICCFLCLLKTECSLFYHNAGTCYMGHFGHLSGGVLNASEDSFYIKKDVGECIASY